MKILFLTQVLPYPPDAGPKFKTWQVLQYLMSQGHQVTLVSIVRSEELRHCEVLDQLVTAFHPIQIQRSRLKDVFYLIRSFLTGRPFLIDRDDLPELRSLLDRLLSSNSYDAIHADQITMTQFALPFADRDKPFLHFDAHNATWKILERLKLESKGFKRLFFHIEANRIRRYEAEVVSRFDRTLAVSQIDWAGLVEAVHQTGLPLAGLEEKCLVIPITVNTREILPVKRSNLSLNIFTMGTLHYPPNADGIRWFIHDVFPLVRQAVPDVTLSIVGKNPPADFLNLQNIEPEVFLVPGYVPDLTPWFEEAGVMVVPVRVGGGMRVRILEAFARQMPVVTTTIGLEGIDATPGRDVLVEDDAEGFANAVINLLKDAALQNRIAQNGRSLVEQVYDQQVVLKKLDQLYPVGEAHR